MNMKIITIISYLVLAGLSIVYIAHADMSPTQVAVYRGPASCDGCSERIKKALENLSPRYNVEFVGADEKVDISSETLSRYDIYIQPGGGQDIPGALESIGNDRVAAIREYVADGGRFLGICMGAYLADAAGIGLIPHHLDTEVGRPGFDVTTIDDAAVPVRWNGKNNSVFYQDGPYFPELHDASIYKRIATYKNGDIAAARYVYGDGVVVLSGPHPEASREWFENAGIPLDQMPRDNLFGSLMRNVEY